MRHIKEARVAMKKHVQMQLPGEVKFRIPAPTAYANLKPELGLDKVVVRPLRPVPGCVNDGVDIVHGGTVLKVNGAALCTIDTASERDALDALILMEQSVTTHQHSTLKEGKKERTRPRREEHDEEQVDLIKKKNKEIQKKEKIKKKTDKLINFNTLTFC